MNVTIKKLAEGLIERRSGRSKKKYTATIPKTLRQYALQTLINGDAPSPLLYEF